MINKVILTLMDKRFKIPDGDINRVAIEKGIKRINESLFPTSTMVDERIVDYVVYFLYLRRNARYRFSEADIFGNYTIEKYRKQFMSESGKSGMNYYINQWLADGGLTRADLTAMIADPKPNKMLKYIYMPSEELIKRRFKNTQTGLMLCQQSTTGWAPRSETCRDCKNAEECKAMTERKYPELIRLRNKDYENYDKEK